MFTLRAPPTAERTLSPSPSPVFPFQTDDVDVDVVCKKSTCLYICIYVIQQLFFKNVQELRCETQSSEKGKCHALG